MSLGDIAKSVADKFRTPVQQKDADAWQQEAYMRADQERQRAAAEQGKAEQVRLQQAEDIKKQRHQQFEADRIMEKAKREQRVIKSQEEVDKKVQESAKKAMEEAKQKELYKMSEEKRVKEFKQAELTKKQAELETYKEQLRDTKHTGNQRAQIRRDLRVKEKEFGIHQPSISERLGSLKKNITPSTIKESIKTSVGKAPARIDSTVTGVFGKVIDTASRVPEKSNYNPKWFKQEQLQMGRAVKLHARQPVTGGKVAQGPIYVTPTVHDRTAISVNPSYMDLLMGGQQPMQKGKKKLQPAGIFSGLDNFVKRI